MFVVVFGKIFVVTIAVLVEILLVFDPIIVVVFVQNLRYLLSYLLHCRIRFHICIC